MVTRPSNASVYDGGEEVSPGGPGQTAVRRTEWFGGGPSRHWLGDARGAGGHTAKEAEIRETVQGSCGIGRLAAWEVAEAQGPPVALRGPTVARGSWGLRKRLSDRQYWSRASMVTRPSNASVYDGGDKVSPGSPGQTAVRRTEWFGGGPSRHWLGDARGAGGHTAREATIRETVQGLFGSGGLAAWEAAEAKGPPVALRGPTVARGS
jgi:hypothetical protein